jgi:class 3 adenylate cyclase/DNA-binding NarL/FixJ family response regulator
VLTLLFSDIEGSTALVDRLGDDYAHVLRDHRRLIGEAVEAHGGRELDARGDELSFVFEDAAGAVGAAGSAQRALGEYPWPGSVDVKVRIGVHTGEPTPAGSSYVGLDVHRTARICDAGHGGQVLLSAATVALVPGIDTRDLGEFELRGLPRPERIFQLVGPGLALDFPPLRIDLPAPPQPAAQLNGDAMKVVIADDSVLLREGIARLLEDAGFDVVAQAGTKDELLLKVRSYTPDVAIVDIRMPPTQTNEGLEAAREIRERHPDTGVLLLSQYVEPGYAMELLSESAEGVGYLLKDRVSDVDEFVSAVRRVGEGGSALDPAVVSQLGGRRRRDDPARARGAGAHGGGPLEPGDRRSTLHHSSRGREARHEHLRQAPAPGRGRGPPAGAGGARLPPQLIAL